MQAGQPTQATKELLRGKTFQIFLDGIRSKASRIAYTKALRRFCKFTCKDTDTLIAEARKDVSNASDIVREYLRYLKERVEQGEIQAASCTNGSRQFIYDTAGLGLGTNLSKRGHL